MNKNKIIYQLSYVALLSALIFLATYFIKIPYFNNSGYFNLSDGLIIFSSIYFGPFVGIFSAIISTSLADLLSGFILSIPFTIFAKGIESILAFIIFKIFYKNKILRYFSLYLSIIPMVLTYFLFYLIIYNFNFYSSYLYSLFDIIQGMVGVSLAILMYFSFNNLNIKYRYQYNLNLKRR